jgi:hypothetical protein
VSEAEEPDAGVSQGCGNTRSADTVGVAAGDTLTFRGELGFDPVAFQDGELGRFLWGARQIFEEDRAQDDCGQSFY